MKKFVVTFLLLGLIFGCESENKLTYDTLQLKGERCKDCPKIEINIPNALDETPMSKVINRALSEEIISILSFNEDESIDAVEKAISSFTDSYKELKKKFPEEIEWEARINGEVVYEDANLVTIKLESYSYTGGAHGYASTSYLNFDKHQASELENWELFSDGEGFAKFAETKFKIQEDIPQDQNINATGFMFDGDTFHLAQNIGYTPKGLQMIYNQYEVASYADGPIVLTLPYNEINLYLKRKVKS